MKKELTVIGIIPQYPQHSQNNIYAKIKMPPVGILSVMSQINHHFHFKEIYAIDENNYNGPQGYRIIFFYKPDSPRNWRSSMEA